MLFMSLTHTRSLFFLKNISKYSIFSKKSLNSLFLILVAMADMIFNKRLIRSDIDRKKLTVPTRALRYFMGIVQERHYADLPVIDWTGQVRHFRIYTRPGGIYRKPVFTTGWPQFVREKGLRVGDEVTFSLNQDGDGGLQYSIFVHRRQQLFSLSGEPIIRDFNEPAFIVPDPSAPIYELDLLSTIA